jgi:PAS domain S-box-containing protein
MNDNEFTFDAQQFNKLFPFYIQINEELNVVAAGQSFLKLFPNALKYPFEHTLRLLRPSHQTKSFNDFNLLLNQVIILEAALPSPVKIIFRGQFEYLSADNRYIFLGSPWINSVDEIMSNNLSLRDFAIHDATIDLLHVVKVHENVTEDLKELLRILNNNKELQKNEEEKIKRLSLVASLNKSGVIFLNSAGYIKWCNEGVSQLTGYSIEEINGQHFAKLGYGPLSSNPAVEDILYQLNEGFSVDATFEYYTKNNGNIWCKGRGQSIPDAIDGEQQFFMIIEDITLQRSNDQKLKILSLIAEDNINAVIIADVHGRIEWINKSFTNMTGYSLDEVKGKKPGEFLQGEASSEETSIYMREQLMLGNDFNTEIINYSRNGDAYWVHIQCQPIKTVAGEVIGYFAIEENITEKRLSRQRLQESEKRLSSLIINLQAGILVEDEKRHIILTNPLFCEMFGIGAPPEALIGADCSQSAEQSKVAFKNQDKFVKDIDLLLTEKKLVIGDVLELNDGRYFSRDYIPIYIDEIYRGHLWKYTDITAEKHAQNALLIREEKYRSIIANMNLGLLEVDANEVIQFANNSFCEMSGFTLAELTGKSAPDLFIADEKDIETAEKNKVRKLGISDAYEKKITNKKGESKWWLISGAPRYNDDGEMVGSIGIHLDITDQKLLQTQLKAAKEIAENAHAAEQEFLANMSHEIRTPLNAIAGMTYLLQDTTVNTEQQEYLDVVQSSTEILLRLVTNILDISKIEAGKIDANIKELDIIRLLKGLEKTIRIQHKNSAVKVLFEYPESHIQYVLSDDLMITQILLNILSNASKFTEKGEIKLQAELYSNNDEKVLLNVMISDTGRGMTKKEQSRVFDKFTQGGDEESRSKGTGLGLAITKKLVEFLNGTIHLESKEGEGTKFNILLPMKKGHSTIMVERPTEVQEIQYNFKGFKVLVAEDNEVNRKYIGKLLSKWEVEYQFAENGVEAIDMLSVPNSFELVLMDLQMPLKDGIEATIDIRNSNAWYKDIPIIGVSATAIIGLKQKARESGINDFVSKPYTPIQLQTAIGRFLKNTQNKVVYEPVPDKNGNFVFNEMLSRKHLHELLGDDFEYAKVLFEIFESTIVPQIDDVKILFDQNEPLAFSKLIHKIKPTFSMVGIPGFDELLNRLELQSGKTDNLLLLKEDYLNFLDRASIYIPIIHSERIRLEKYLKNKMN